MSSDRGSWWSITINNPTQLEYDKLKSPPAFVREMWYQTEIGSKCGTKHIQLCLNTTYSRFGSIKLWLPTAHIELAREKAKLINYCRKSETSVAGSFVHWPDRPTNEIIEVNDEDPAPALNQILYTMTDYLTNDYVEKLTTPGTIPVTTDVDDYTYKHIVRCAYAEGKLKEADSFFGRNVKQAFVIAWRVFFMKHLADRQTEAVQEEIAQMDDVSEYLPEYKSRCLISED